MVRGAFSGELSEDESILWQGAPREGFRFTLMDIPLVLFGLFFTGISLVFVSSLFPFGLLLPHFWVGLYFVGGRFFVERKIRQNTSYAVTERRALIRRTWPMKKSSSVNLETVPEISVAEHADGTGTITFGTTTPFNRMSWPGQRGAPAFEFIDDAERVMRFIRR